MENKSLVDSTVYKGEYFFVTRENYENRKTPIYFIFDNTVFQKLLQYVIYFKIYNQ